MSLMMTFLVPGVSEVLFVIFVCC